MPKLSLYLLGPPRIELGGEPIDLHRRKLIALLAYLAATEQPQSRGVLTHLLYPRSDRSHARSGFRRTLSMLKHALGDQWLTVDGNHVSLNSNHELWVDVSQFRLLMKEATHLHGSSDEIDDDLAETFHNAAELYQGEFLSGFYLKDSPEFDDWQFLQQESLREQYAFALEMLVEKYGSLTQYKSAIHCAQKWLSLDPLTEHIHRQLMRLYSIDGQYPAALRQYEKCRSVLTAELGVVPDERTEKLYREIQKKRSAYPLKREHSTSSSLTEENTRVVSVLAVGMESPISDDLNVESEWGADTESPFSTAVAKIMSRYNAYVEQSLAGETVAIFGYPHSHEDDVERALQASLVIEEEAQRLELRVSQGVSTGVILVRSKQGERENRLSMTGRALQRASQLRHRAQTGVVLADRSTYKRAFRTFDFKQKRLTLTGVSSEVFLVSGIKHRPEKTSGIEGLRAPLIGRPDEMRQLKQTLLNVETDGGHFVSIIGEAGIGKSRIVSELRNYVFSPDYRGPSPLWLEGRCQEMGMTTGYWPFLNMLSSLFLSNGEDLASGITSLLRSIVYQGYLAKEQIEAMGPLFESLLSIYGSQDDSIRSAYPREIQYRTFHAVKTFFTALSKQQPVVLVFDDLHWADTVSLDLLSLLMEAISSASLILICVLRPEADSRSRRIQDIAFKKCTDRYAELKLGRLTRRQSLEMFDSILHPNEIAPAAKQLIGTMSEGNPFYLEELIRSLINSGEIYREGNRWHSRREVPAVSASENVLRIVQDRTDVLKPESKNLLQDAAVIGSVFSWRILEEIASPEVNVDEIFHDLDNRDFIYEETTLPEKECCFKHVLIQRAIYQMIPPPRRKIVHGRIGETIEDFYKNNLFSQYEKLAYHYELSDNAEKALEYLIKAGQKSARRYANHEALNYLRKALDRAQAGEDRDCILRCRAQVYMDQLKGKEAARDYEELLERAKDSGKRKAEL